MNICEDFNLILKCKHIPAGCIKLQGNELLECIQYSNWKENKELDATKVVCDNPVWVAKNSNANLYSSDGAYLYISSNGRTMGKFSVSGETKTLEQILTLGRDENIKKFSDLKVTTKIEEDLKMDENVKARLEQAKAKAKQKGGMGAVSIDGETKKVDPALEMTLKAKETAVNEITAEIKNVKLADTREIKALNYKMGTLVGHIVEEDDKIVASAVSVADRDAEGNKIKKTDATTVADVEVGGETKVAKAAFVTHKEVAVKHKGPRKIHGVILKMPEAGIIDYNKLNDPNATFEVDYDKKGFVYLAQPLERAAATITKFFEGARVAEDPATHANPANYKVEVVARPKKSKVAGDPVVYEDVIKMGSERKGSILTPTNYIPRRVPKTIAFSKYTDGASKKVIVDSLFYTIAKSDKFDEIQANPIQRVQNGIYFDVTSDYTEGKKALEVSSYFGGTLNDLQIPIKNIVPTKKNDATRAVAVSFDVLGKNEGLEELNPLTSAKFETIRNAAGGKITVDMFREVIPQKTRKSNAKSKTHVWSAEDAEKLISAGKVKLGGETLEGLEAQMRDAFMSIKLG